VSDLNERQIAALLCDERAIENLSTEDRDDMIVKGFAHRAWPNTTGCGWKTWLTKEGLELRMTIAKHKEDREIASMSFPDYSKGLPLPR